MLARTCCFALQGVEGIPVTVEAYVAGGQQTIFTIVGLPDAAVRESRDRVFAALKNNGFSVPFGHITVSLSPADVRKEGAAFDLSIAVALVIATRQVKPIDCENILLMGELALDGRLVPVRGALSMVLSAHEHGIRDVIMPAENAPEVQAVQGMRVYPAHTLYEAVMHLTGAAPLLAQQQKTYEECLRERAVTSDMSSIRGQAGARRALEVAAAGGHNMLMVGVPGSGKTMLARCLPGILPRMTMEEAFETTRIHSAAGILPTGTGLLTERPFRTPHHSASMPSLVGGGANAIPGEISLAHNGVLFLDELPEYSRTALEALRQPLEDGVCTVSRVRAHMQYQCRCMLVASMNPCPCGYYGSAVRQCTCGSHEIRRYLDRISGPLLDRIDLHIEVDAVPVDEITADAKGESSEAVRQRVELARQRQRDRFAHAGISCNAQMNNKHIEELACLSDAARTLLTRAVDKYALSMRGYTRLIKVARTVADLRGDPEISAPAMAEAIQYRMLDAKYWNR
ncbi:MAG: YifB family Mg chelatase-like AAA ATPase [Clostridia bacterium]|nr:YifB family Mg chelatase-like AAA ATPase [Clostridia bacterium]